MDRAGAGAARADFNREAGGYASGFASGGPQDDNPEVRSALRQVLPFHPTQAQKTALGEIVADMRVFVDELVTRIAETYS